MAKSDDQDDKEMELFSSDSADTLDDATDLGDGTTLDADKEAPAASSAATDDDDSPLNVVRDVLDERKDKASTASSADGNDAGATAGGKDPKEPDNENYTDVPFHKHPRFQEIIRERNSLREDAGRYQNVQNFLDENGLSSEEAANGLAVLARAKTDPAGAWVEIKPWVQQLLIDAGEVLPDDLAQRVKAGELTQEAALEISKSRATVKSVDTRKSFEQQQRERRQQTELGNSLMKAASDWEADRRKFDPNFAAKLIPLQKEIAWLHSTEGKPKTPEGVREQLKKAYDTVNKSFKPAVVTRQQKPAVRPVTGGQVAGTVREAPKSTLDIVRANRRQAAS